MPDVSVLEIRLHDEPIGTLTHMGGDKTIFAFNDKYIQEKNRPLLGLGFKDQSGDLITDFRPYNTQVMPFFSNLLPEGELRKYLADLAGINQVREFFLLWILGKDLPGAITITSAGGDEWRPDHPDSKEIESAEARETSEEQLRFSLAGVQMKFSAVSNAAGGLTIPVNGQGGSWIVKLPSSKFNHVPENEFSMMTLAGRVGINVPAIKLIDVDQIENLPGGVSRWGKQAFAIERFDRLSDGSRVHMEDFAQIFGVYPADKYINASMRNIAEVIAIEGSNDDIAELIRRLTFNTLIGNADMHLKNWSMIYLDQRTPSIAPAYDFVSTIAYLPDEKAALKFSRKKRFSEYTIDELAHLAAKARLPEKLVLETARATAELFHQVWTAEKKHLPMEEGVVRAIEAHLKTISLDQSLFASAAS